MYHIHRTGSVQAQNRGSEPTQQFWMEYISVYIIHTNIHRGVERDIYIIYDLR